MSFAWGARAAAAFLALAWACNGAPLSRTPPPGGTPDAGPSPSASLRFEVDPGLECADAGAAGICVAPSQAVSFAVEGLPGTVVSLSLQGSYADAALTTQRVTLGPAPTPVILESSSTTATFSVVASVGAISQGVTLPVSVATSGTATIEASPVYSGHRRANEFYAAAFVLSTCAELTANAPDASTAAWTAGPSGVAIALTAPAGERVAVQMRIGHYAFGCADVDPLVPAATVSRPVQLYDVPMALALTDLTATFSFASDGGTAPLPWSGVASAAAARIEATFFASASPDGSALLDAMRGAIGNAADQVQFDAARQQGGWDSAVATWLSSHTPTIKDRAASWLSAAESAGIGPLVVTIGNGTSAGTAPVTAATFHSLSWVAAGLAQPAPFEWTADANDLVHLSGAIDLASTPLVAHEADALAASGDAGATDVPSAIATGIDCNALAASLVGGGVSYGGCNATCTGSLCGAALLELWKAASAAAGNGADTVHTTIIASAPATVGDSAEPAVVQGGWLGNVSGAGVPTSFAVTGSLLAMEPDAGGP